MLFLLFKNFNVVCIMQYFYELKMFKIIIVIVIILMMMMTFKDQFLLPYTCNIRVLFLNKVFLLLLLLLLIIIIIITIIIIIIIIVIIIIVIRVVFRATYSCNENGTHFF